MFPLHDSTRAVRLDQPCRQLLVHWEMMLDVTGRAGRAGLCLDGGDVVAHHMFERGFSGNTVIIIWAFPDVSAGSHTIQGVGQGIGVLASHIEAIPID